MKKLLIAILIILSGQLSATTVGGPEKTVSLKKQIDTFLNTAKAPVYQDVVVKVKFKLNEKNAIIITSIGSNEYEIRKYIRKSLNGKILKIDESNKTANYTIPVRFIAKTR